MLSFQHTDHDPLFDDIFNRLPTKENTQSRLPLKMTLLTPTIISELTALYSQPTRHYHTLNHVNALLSLLDHHRHHFLDSDTVEATIWFHDAIYDSRAKGHDNELKSAQLAVERLTELGVDSDRVERIRGMIEATATHKLSSGSSTSDLSEKGVVRDMALFLDMDLSILGAEEGEFDEYEAAVRREYDWVSEEAWREGRGKVLIGLLGSSVDRDDDCEAESDDGGNKKGIYHTDLFGGLLEEKARGNIKRSLGKLDRASGE